MASTSVSILRALKATRSQKISLPKTKGRREAALCSLCFSLFLSISLSLYARGSQKQTHVSTKRRRRRHGAGDHARDDGGLCGALPLVAEE